MGISTQHTFSSHTPHLCLSAPLQPCKRSLIQSVCVLALVSVCVRVTAVQYPCLSTQVCVYVKLLGVLILIHTFLILGWFLLLRLGRIIVLVLESNCVGLTRHFSFYTMCVKKRVSVCVCVCIQLWILKWLRYQILFKSRLKFGMPLGMRFEH